MTAKLRSRLVLGIGCALAACQLGATSIQLSPLVGRRTEGLYRAPSYLRSVDQYSREAEEDYTIKISNLRLQLSVGLEVEFDDNLNRAPNRSKDEGLAVTPQLMIKIHWPLNPGFRIYSGVVIGYRQYLSGGDDADDEGLSITGTDGAFSAQVGFDMRVGSNGILSASEEFSRTMDTFEAGNRDNRRLSVNRNLINLQYHNAFTDLTSGTAKFTHTNQWTDGSDYEQANYFSDFLDVALMRSMNRSWQLGVYGRGGLHVYTDDMHNDSTQYAAGISTSYSRTEKLALSGSLGLSRVDFETDNSPTATDEYTGWTTQWAVRYSNNEITTHRLVLTYGAEQGFLDPNSNYSKELMTQYSISIQLHEDLLANGDAGYINARESDGGDNYDLYRTGVGLGYRLTRDTTVDLRYVREWRDSDDNVASEYTRNLVTLRLLHRF